MNIILSTLSKLLPCLPAFSTPQVSIRGRTYKIVRLLGEGAFSYVYLVLDSKNPCALYALKKVRCPFGANDESFRTGKRELENYARFAPAKCPYIILPIDEMVVNEPDGLISVYVVLPYFEQSLQDIVNQLVLSQSHLDQNQILAYFIAIARAIKIMHLYQGVSDDAHGTNMNANADAHSLAIEENDLLLGADPQPYTDVSMQSVTAMPYAHHDIKPANVMILREGLAVVVDLGSCSPATVTVKNRQQALSVTDFALQHCTLAYRAPELLDVQTNTTITEKTDIWSLGCLLYCCCFGYSPFEKLEHDEGANLGVAIAQGRYIIPESHEKYSPELLSIIKDCLQLEPEKRPSIQAILERALQIASAS